MSQSKETRTLPVNLTNAELQDMGNRASGLFKESTELEVKRKQADTKAKNEISLIESEFSKLQRYIYEKKEPRPVDCMWFINRPLKVKVLRRLDTMQAIETIPLKAEDLQDDLFNGEVKEKLEDDPGNHPNSKVIDIKLLNGTNDSELE